ncbi:protein trichome birefringence-like 8 [Hevea brasiliensis]|uniref:protein trichome birefringence-like 8 n=1 Tax=Hevea brasiliensis TaxID=3981 RepID=UPI0025CBEAB8|nr:protein trichome birefringence-like 8 [Hevea brasiliensis]
MDHHQSTAQKHHRFSLPIVIKRQLLYAISFLIFLILSVLVFDLLPPFEPHQLSRFGFLSQILLNNKKSSQGSCNYSYGRWVRDESYYKIQSYDETCPFLDPGFRCRQCGRKDVEYLNWRWQPKGCEIPRFNASDLLERSRNGRIVFAGDSIARNQWESFLCMLGQGVHNKSTIYEEHGKPITKHKGFLSMRFSEYNLTVEYYRVPFLVVVGRPTLNSSTEVKMTIKVDQMHWFSRKWVGADILVFSGGHWWNEDKTVEMGCYFEDGGKVNTSMSVMEAFQRSLQTWKSWALQNLDRESYIFFRSFSPVHYRNGTWNIEGRCDVDMQPETNYMNLEPEPVNNQLISDMIKQMELEYRNSKVQYLNITYLTQFRFDGHPSVHREPGTPVPAPQDCSHWCLPGVPDVWNEILYAHLRSMGFKTK